ncbi:hypothetical protein GVAV_002617 [Gurleya vavrai]
MEEYLYRFNNYLQDTKQEPDLFSKNAFIRLNMLYISPTTIPQFKTRLSHLGMTSWKIDESGFRFTFDYNKSNFNSHDPCLYEIHFRGLSTFHYNKKQQIYAFELDFDPIVGKKEAYNILFEIEFFLKGCDSVFFMCYEIDIDNEILSNPLSRSVDFLYKRIEEHSKSDLPEE